MICYSAPGKAVLCGEYAVLTGAPAIAVAVNRRVRVSVTRAAAGDNSVIAPGVQDSAAHFEMCSDGGLRWRDPRAAKKLRLFETALEDALQTWPQIRQHGLTAVLDSNALYFAGAKLGIGSSAALTVALGAAFAALGGAETDLLRLTESHRRWQAERGSGIDIATSFRGGLQRFQNLDGAIQTESLRWPAGLKMQFFFTGQAASTAGSLEVFERWRGQCQRAPAMLSTMTATADDASRAWCGGVAQQVLDTTRAFTAALGDLDQASGLGIFAAGHRQLYELANTHEVAYKPCGAGGGDIGVALSCDGDALARFSQRVQSDAVTALNLDVDNSGLRQESSDD